MPEGVTGIALSRKFPKEEGEEYYYEYLYSVWLYCEKEEVSGEIEVKLDLFKDPLNIDWEGKETQLKKDSVLKVSSTPTFLLLEEKRKDDKKDESDENDKKDENDENDKKDENGGNDKKNETEKNGSSFSSFKAMLLILSLAFLS